MDDQQFLGLKMNRNMISEAIETMRHIIYLLRPDPVYTTYNTKTTINYLNLFYSLIVRKRI